MKWILKSFSSNKDESLCPFNFHLCPEMHEIHLIPKWRPINCSFVCMLINPLCLVNIYQKQKNLLINMQTRE